MLQLRVVASNYRSSLSGIWAHSLLDMNADPFNYSTYSYMLPISVKLYTVTQFD